MVDLNVISKNFVKDLFGFAKKEIESRSNSSLNENAQQFSNKFITSIFYNVSSKDLDIREKKEIDKEKESVKLKFDKKFNN